MDAEQEFFDDPVKVYLAEVGKLPPLSRAEELDCIQEIRAGGPQAGIAERRLVESNLRLVVSIAERKKDSRVHILDLIRKGNEGLLSASRALSTTDQDNFTVLATAHVERAIEDALTHEGRESET